MSEAVSAQGVVIKRGDGATPAEAFTAIAEVKDISGPSESADQIECTHLGSTHKEFIPGLRDGGEVSCEANAIAKDEQQQALYSDFQAGTKRNYKITCPDGEEFAFNALITKHDRKFGVNSVETVSFTLKISGEVDATFPA